MNNLFASLPTDLPEEVVEVLTENQHVRIERIVSTGQSSPKDFWYDQDQAEWVVVLQGEAQLLLEGDQQPIHMKPGDYINIPAHRKHRVEWTTANEIQEGFLEAAKRIQDYCQAPQAPFFLWLRSLVGYKLLEIHRHHLGVKARNAAREISIFGGPLPEATTTMLAERLLGRLSSPSQAASRAEMKIRLQEALNQMARLDREVIALRHFEQLSNAETALALHLSEAAASSRYGILRDAVHSGTLAGTGQERAI